MYKTQEPIFPMLPIRLSRFIVTTVTKLHSIVNQNLLVLQKLGEVGGPAG